MDDQSLLDGWYRFAAKSDGFIGKALATQREQTQTTIQQQRTSLGVTDTSYDHFWLHLQGMHLPRKEQWESDIERIVAYLLEREGITEGTVNVSALSALLHVDE